MWHLGVLELRKLLHNCWWYQNGTSEWWASIEFTSCYQNAWIKFLENLLNNCLIHSSLALIKNQNTILFMDLVDVVSCNLIDDSSF
jgi:hypothetical protein